MESKKFWFDKLDNKTFNQALDRAHSWDDIKTNQLLNMN